MHRKECIVTDLSKIENKRRLFRLLFALVLRWSIKHRCVLPGKGTGGSRADRHSHLFSHSLGDIPATFLKQLLK